jgi:CBS domain-containing protein/sporulation protein YlmC with PRC-barrel domain
MIYLSDLLNRKVYFNRKVFGEMVDFAVQEQTPNPSVSKVVIKRKGKKLTISPSFLAIKPNFAVLTDDKAPLLPFDEGDFYLNEDLLDKQVIDTNDKRLVRVNDIVFESEQELKVIGIDIGTAGLLRRLGIKRFINPPAKILPWQMIEAFDYQTGNIKINLTQHKLESMHPSEKMHVSEIAEIFYKINPLRIREILKFIGSERAGKVEKLLDFRADTAGAAMRTGFASLDGNTTVKEAFNALYKLVPKPEAIIITNGNEKLVGTIYTKDILDSDSLAILKDIVTDRKFVVPDTDFNQVISLFGRYNLRALPVVDKDKKPLGVITAGIVLSKIEERTQTDEFI